MNQFLPDPGADHLMAAHGSDQIPLATPPLSINYACNRADGDRELGDRSTAALYGIFRDLPAGVKAKLDDLQSIARLMADTLSWGNPDDPMTKRALTNSLILAFRSGGECGEKELTEEINANLAAPLTIERIDELPPMSQQIESQRVYVLRDRETGHNIAVTAFEIDGQVESQE